MLYSICWNTVLDYVLFTSIDIKAAGFIVSLGEGCMLSYALILLFPSYEAKIGIIFSYIAISPSYSELIANLFDEPILCKLMRFLPVKGYLRPVLIDLSRAFVWSLFSKEIVRPSIALCYVLRWLCIDS